jgi:hypothetical protein
MYEEPVFVDELVLDERLDEDATPEHGDATFAVRLQIIHRRNDVAGEHAQARRVKVVVTTYFGVALRCAAIGLSSGSFGQCAAIFS